MECNCPHFTSTLFSHGYNQPEFLGKGSYSSVFKVHSLQYKKSFVVKVIKYKKCDEGMNDMKYMREVNALSCLNHPGIINFYDRFNDENLMFMVLEYCPNGTLAKQIKTGKTYNGPFFLKLARDLTLAMSHCHHRSVFHRDIKPDNILIDKFNRPRLADFGLSHQGCQNDKNRVIGTLAFMPPELFGNSPIIDLAKADVWSLGVTLYNALTGSLPWFAGDDKAIEAQIKECIISFPQESDKFCVDLVKAMMNPNPITRPTLLEILDLISSHEGKKIEASRLNYSKKVSMKNTLIFSKKRQLNDEVPFFKPDPCFSQTFM